MQAATRVNPEQASKVKSRTPTRLRYGEGRWMRVEEPSDAVRIVRRGSGSGMHARSNAQRGRSALVLTERPQLLARRRRARKSEGPVVPLKLVNASGGKGPCFWGAFGVDPEGRLA